MICALVLLTMAAPGVIGRRSPSSRRCVTSFLRVLRITTKTSFVLWLALVLALVAVHRHASAITTVTPSPALSDHQPTSTGRKNHILQPPRLSTGTTLKQTIGSQIKNDVLEKNTTKWSPIPQTSNSDPAEKNIHILPSKSDRAVSVTTTTTFIPPRVAYIAFCHLQGTQRMEDFIFSSVETWHPRDQPYFVVFTASSKPIWDDYVVTNSNFTEYQARIQPLFVDCPEGKFGESPCCKQEKGLLAVLDQYGSSYDWFLFQDDDVYLRHEYLQSYVTPLNPNQVQILSAGMPAKRLGQMGYIYKPSDMQYFCSHKNNQYTYPWGMPVVYSKAALLLVSNGFRQGGLVSQCVAFNITHDTGNAIYHWMYSLPSIWLRVPGLADWYRDDFFGAHGVGRATDYKNATETNMYALHKTYSSRRYRPPINVTYVWHNVTGFRTTKTYKDYGDPAHWTEWHTFPVKDCLGRGK
jgi:hypothetical protein